VRKQKAKLGFAPTRRPNPVFSPEWARQQKKRIEAKLKEWEIDYIGLDWLNEEGMLSEGVDAYRVAKRFKAEGVDALFVPHCNFGSETAVGTLAREVDKPLLLWGPRDGTPPPEGRRLADTQCGLFATSKMLRRMNTPFTYIVNSAIDSALFERGVHLFMGVAGAVNNFLGARIGQIGSRPTLFSTVIINESQLVERWGIQVLPFTMMDVQHAIFAKEEEDSEMLAETVAELRAIADLSRMSEKQARRLAALKLALVELCEIHRLDALALNCGAPFRKSDLGIRACFVNGVLADMGIPVACEGDVHGALTALLVQGAVSNRTSVFCADLTIRHPENDNGELLWHVGCFPPSLAAEPESRWVDVDRGCAGVGNWELRGGDLTISRFDADHGRYSLFIGEARGISGPPTGWTYLWVEVDDWPKWEEKFVYGPYIHHCTVVHESVAPILYEACRYIPGVEPDVLEPLGQEIQAYWRGEDLYGGAS
jgi:L-fucose isomerase-like protein